MSNTTETANATVEVVGATPAAEVQVQVPANTIAGVPVFTAPKGSPLPGADDEALGEGGLKALNTEREARKAAEKAAAEALARVKEFEDRDKSEAEKQAEKFAEMQSELERFREADERRNWAREVSKETGIPVDVVESLRGDSQESLLANAERLAPAFKPQEQEVVEQPAPRPVTSIGEQPSTANVPLKDQITAAEAADNKDLVAVLKAMQLGN